MQKVLWNAVFGADPWGERRGSWLRQPRDDHGEVLRNLAIAKRARAPPAEMQPSKTAAERA